MAEKLGLTGNQRYRAARIKNGLFSTKEVLILQVEERRWHDTFTPVSVDSDVITIWRDAKTEDVTELGFIQGVSDGSER